MSAMETCDGCAAGDVITMASDDDLAFCTFHWNWWITKYYLGGGEWPPCAAHLIRGQA